MTTLRYYGHSCFALTEGETTILVDPFLSQNPLAGSVPADLKPEVILLSHAHSDHLGDTLQIARDSDASVVAIFEIAVYLNRKGIEKALMTNLGGTVRFSWGSVKLVQAFHSSSIDDGEQLLPGGTACGFIIRIGGKSIYYTGDTSLFGDMRLIAESVKPQVDLAILPIGDNFTMGIEDAVTATGLIKPRVVLPVHYGTFPIIEADPQEFKRQVEEATDARCIVLEPGSEYTLE